MPLEAVNPPSNNKPFILRYTYEYIDTDIVFYFHVNST
jgi:hypothetical protein